MFNSYHLFIRDDVGCEFMHTFATNTVEGLAASRKHAREWLAYVRRHARRGTYRDRLGRHLNSPCGRAEIIVEFYDDASASSAAFPDDSGARAHVVI